MGKEEKEYEECEKNARPLLLEIDALSKELKDWEGEEAVAAIEAAARDALRALAGTEHLLKKAQDYLANRRFLKKELSLTVHVQDEKAKPIQGAQVNVQFSRSKEQNKERTELQEKILKGEKIKDENQRQRAVDFARSQGAKGGRTNAAGDAQIKVMAGWDMKVQVSAEGYRAASAIKKAIASSSSISLMLTADKYVDKIFFLWSFHTEVRFGSTPEPVLVSYICIVVLASH